MDARARTLAGATPAQHAQAPLAGPAALPHRVTAPSGSAGSAPLLQPHRSSPSGAPPPSASPSKSPGDPAAAAPPRPTPQQLHLAHLQEQIKQRTALLNSVLISSGRPPVDPATLVTAVRTGSFAAAAAAGNGGTHPAPQPSGASPRVDAAHGAGHVDAVPGGSPSQGAAAALPAAAGAGDAMATGAGGSPLRHQQAAPLLRSTPAAEDDGAVRAAPLEAAPGAAGSTAHLLRPPSAPPSHDSLPAPPAADSAPPPPHHYLYPPRVHPFAVALGAAEAAAPQHRSAIAAAAAAPALAPPAAPAQQQQPAQPPQQPPPPQQLSGAVRLATPQDPRLMDVHHKVNPVSVYEMDALFGPHPVVPLSATVQLELDGHMLPNTVFHVTIKRTGGYYLTGLSSAMCLGRWHVGWRREPDLPTAPPRPLLVRVMVSTPERTDAVRARCTRAISTMTHLAPAAAAALANMAAGGGAAAAAAAAAAQGEGAVAQLVRSGSLGGGAAAPPVGLALGRAGSAGLGAGGAARGPSGGGAAGGGGGGGFMAHLLAAADSLQSELPRGAGGGPLSSGAVTPSSTQSGEVAGDAGDAALVQPLQQHHHQHEGGEEAGAMEEEAAARGPGTATAAAPAVAVGPDGQPVDEFGYMVGGPGSLAYTQRRYLDNYKSVSFVRTNELKQLFGAEARARLPIHCCLRVSWRSQILSSRLPACLPASVRASERASSTRRCAGAGGGAWH